VSSPSLHTHSRKLSFLTAKIQRVKMIQNLAAQGKVPLDFSKIPDSISLGSISLTLDIEQIGMATG